MRPPGDPPIFVFALVAVPCLVLMAAAVPLMRRRVPPNAWYGLRVPATLADREIWYAANVRAGRGLFGLALLDLGLLVALPQLAPGLHGSARVLVPLWMLAGGAVSVGAYGWWYAARLRAARRRGARSDEPA